MTSDNIILFVMHAQPMEYHIPRRLNEINDDRDRNALNIRQNTGEALYYSYVLEADEMISSRNRKQNFHLVNGSEFGDLITVRSNVFCALGTRNEIAVEVYRN